MLCTAVNSLYCDVNVVIWKSWNSNGMGSVEQLHNYCGFFRNQLGEILAPYFGILSEVVSKGYFNYDTKQNNCMTQGFFVIIIIWRK